MEYTKDQIVWYSPPNSRLLIRCTILKVDYTFRNKNPNAYLFYTIDEPTGHDLVENDLYLTKEECEKAMEKNLRICHTLNLLAWRKYQLKFIVGTWETVSEKEKNIEMLLKDYPNKEQNKDWFLIY